MVVGIITTGDLVGYIHRLEHEYFRANSAWVEEFKPTYDPDAETLVELNRIRAAFGLPALTIEHFVEARK